MTVLFGTLGFTPQKLLPSVSAHPDVTGLVFYHDRHDRSRKAARDVRAFCKERGLDVRGRELDAYDIIECARAMREDLQKAGPSNVVFNITGGTPVISSAATLACILEGVRAVYIDERDGREVMLPLLSVRYDEILNPQQREILSFVARHPGCTQGDVVEGLGRSRATVSHHVRNLKAKMLLRVEPHADDSRRDSLRVHESATLLLMEDAR